MTTRDLKAVVVDLFVTPTPDDRPWLETLDRGDDLSVKMWRARVTSQDLWLQFDISAVAGAGGAFVRHRKNEITMVMHHVGSIV